MTNTVHRLKRTDWFVRALFGVGTCHEIFTPPYQPEAASVIGVAATFESDEAANSLLGVLNQRELSPHRVGVTTSGHGGVAIIVQTDEADYEEMAELMRGRGATKVEVDSTGLEEGSSGVPTLTDSEPPPLRDSD